MTITAEITSVDITERLDALASKTAGLEEQANQVAYDMLMGDEAARAKHAELKEQLTDAAGAREALERALGIAKAREATELAEALEVERKAHMVAARDRAQELMALVKEADAFAMKYWRLFHALGEAQDAVFRELRAAGKHRENPIFWGVSVARHFRDLMSDVEDAHYGKKEGENRFEDGVRRSLVGKLAAGEWE